MVVTRFLPLLILLAAVPHAAASDAGPAAPEHALDALLRDEFALTMSTLGPAEGTGGVIIVPHIDVEGRIAYAVATIALEDAPKTPESATRPLCEYETRHGEPVARIMAAPRTSERTGELSADTPLWVPVLDFPDHCAVPDLVCVQSYPESLLCNGDVVAYVCYNAHCDDITDLAGDAERQVQDAAQTVALQDDEHLHVLLGDLSGSPLVAFVDCHYASPATCDTTIVATLRDSLIPGSQVLDPRSAVCSDEPWVVPVLGDLTADPVTDLALGLQGAGESKIHALYTVSDPWALEQAGQEAEMAADNFKALSGSLIPYPTGWYVPGMPVDYDGLVYSHRDQTCEGVKPFEERIEVIEESIEAYRNHLENSIDDDVETL